MIILNIKDFSLTPGIKTSEANCFSGKEYLSIHLIPAFKKVISENKKIKIILDGTLGIPTSFLEELFGGLVSDFGFDKVKNNIEIVSTQRPFYLDDISEYMDNANKK